MAQIRLLLYPLTLDVVDFIDIVADRAESYTASARNADPGGSQQEPAGQPTPSFPTSSFCTTSDSNSASSGCSGSGGDSTEVQQQIHDSATSPPQVSSHLEPMFGGSHWTKEASSGDGPSSFAMKTL